MEFSRWDLSTLLWERTFILEAESNWSNPNLETKISLLLYQHVKSISSGNELCYWWWDMVRHKGLNPPVPNPLKSV